MIKYVIILNCYLSFIGHSQVTNELFTDVITDPAVSFRCKELIKRRNEKVSIKQKAQFLLQKSKKLRDVTPINKKSVKRKLQRNAIALDQKLHILGLEISRMEEDIVRKGCPGLIL